MGRGKVQLKRIEDKNSRQVTFSKRRTGLIKKARELSILCDVEIALIVFSARGKLYQFCTGDSLRKVLERYQIHKDAEVAGSSVQESKKLTEGYMDFSRGTNLLQMVQRHFEEQKIEQLDVAELTQVEHQLDAILRQTRIKKSQLMMKAVTALHEKEEQPREGRQLMEKEITAMINEATMDDDCRRRRRHQQQQTQQGDPDMDLELYGYTNNTNNNNNSSTGSGGGGVYHHLQQEESMFYLL
ncbi:unnamed protein product [Camellia sinensis]